MTDSAQLPISAPVASFEANVVVSGIAGVTVGWIAYAAILGRSLSLPLAHDWSWTYAIYGAVGAVGVILVGFAVEGLAGVFEYLITRHLRGKRRGQNREWYVRAAGVPVSWGQGQLWMWKSPQAAQEFARRRLRLLVCRNTSFLLLTLTLALAVATLRHRPSNWGWLLLGIVIVGIVSSTLFAWLWMDAHKGWNRAVHDASAIGPP